MKNKKDKSKQKDDARFLLGTKQFGLPCIIIVVVHFLIEMVLTFLTFANGLTTFRQEIHQNEYWFFRIIFFPLVSGGYLIFLSPVWLESILTICGGMMAIVGVVLPTRKTRAKKRLIKGFSIVSLIHIIICFIFAAIFFVWSYVFSFDGIDIEGLFGLEHLVLYSLIYGGVMLLTAISSIVANRVLFRIIVQKNSLDVTGEKEDSPKEGGGNQKGKENKKNIKQAGANKISSISNIAFAFGVFSILCQTVLLIFVLILQHWKRHPFLLFTGVFGILPIVGLVLAIVALIRSSIRKEKKIRNQSVMALAFNAYSLVPAIMMFGLIIICLFRLFFTDSVLSGKDRRLFALEDQYGEEFIVVSDKYYAPKNNPDLVFSRDYHKAYVAKMIEAKLQEELKEFYPGAYIYVDPDDVYMSLKDDYTFQGTTLKDNIVRAGGVDFRGDYPDRCYMHIMLNKDVGTPGKYEEEYKYFTEQIMNEIRNNEMLPLSIDYLWVDGATIERAKQYLKKSPYDLSGSMDTQVWGFDYDFHHVDYEKGEMGNPPSFNANFYPPGSEYKLIEKEQFIRLRKMLESK